MLKYAHNNERSILMYLRILKKDLKRKKAMNLILLVFIILAAMFVSSSVNNIISVTTALDDYFEKADAPDYFAAAMNKAGNTDLEKEFGEIPSIDSFRCEKILYISKSNTKKNGKQLISSADSEMLQGDSDLSINYFLGDNSVLKKVPKGKVYITAGTMENAGLEIGDVITIEIGGLNKEFVVAGGIRDAVLGSNMMSMTRFIISQEDFDDFISDSEINLMYGGSFAYIKASDIDKMLADISDISDSFIFSMDAALMKFTYVFDMIVTGIILVVSLVLIAIAFVVLRFTITFTLSEEFREIGVMKAIGIPNLKIRGLYLAKYAALSVIGAAIGLALSFPFGNLLLSVYSRSVIIGSQNTAFINVLCSVFVVAVILLFCFGCTGKVRKMRPIDAIRNGQTGERFRKKSLMNLSKSKLGTTPFLALNDIVSSPKRFGIITLTFTLCLSLLLMLSAAVSTLKSDSLINCFGAAHCDIAIDAGDKIMSYMVEGGRDKLKEYLSDMEEKLAENDMPAKCIQEIMFNTTVSHGENKKKLVTYQGTGSTMDMYAYTKGSAPQNCTEIAITGNAAKKLNVSIGDTVTIKTIDGEKDYIITAFFQTMNNMGEAVRLYSDEYINYIQASGDLNTQIIFTDNPNDAEIQRRIEKIGRLFPDFNKILTCREWVQENVGVVETLDAVKLMVVLLTIILTALITVLMERSFIAKEQGEIALMKAVGFRNSKIYAFHSARFAAIGVIAAIIAELLSFPLTRLCIDPIFRMMGMETNVDYAFNHVEMFLLFPPAILVTTIISAFLTSLYTRKIKPADTASIE